MVVIYEMQKIKDMMKHSCNLTRGVGFVVDNYDDVIREWRSYKKHKTHINPKLQDIFDFHDASHDHIILYWSCTQNDCLLMCKIANKYINISMPMSIDNRTKSFFATYT
jgi:hypothetical protein